MMCLMNLTTGQTTSNKNLSVLVHTFRATVRHSKEEWLENPDYQELQVVSKLSQRGEMTEVVLVDERSGPDPRRIWVSIDADGINY